MGFAGGVKVGEFTHDFIPCTHFCINSICSSFYKSERLTLFAQIYERSRMIQVRFFASLREEMGREGAELEAVEASTIGEVWEKVAAGKERPANLLMAKNMDYSGPDTPVCDGDEVAFFPPVTGG
jgi:molybdopterin synthase sulfur carrier subunit